MPVVMSMVWKGLKPEEYEQARKIVNWEGNVPQGAIFHVASFDLGGLYVTDVWESAEDFQRFVDSRLMPVVNQLGIASQPEVQIRPVHATFAPGFGKERTRGR